MFIYFVHEFEFEFIRKYNTITILNVVDCVPSRIENAKYNTHDKRNIMMTDDSHVPVTSAEL